MRSKPDLSAAPPTTVLGDWYANVVTLARRPYVLAVSERTFLPVIVPLREATTLRVRVQEQVGQVLLRLRIPQEQFEREITAMNECGLGTTESRRVVGVMVDFAKMFQYAGQPEAGLVRESLHLAETPCGPLKYNSPIRATRALFDQQG